MRNAANLQAIKKAQDEANRRALLREKRRREAEAKRKMLAEKRRRERQARDEMLAEKRRRDREKAAGGGSRRKPDDPTPSTTRPRDPAGRRRGSDSDTLFDPDQHVQPVSKKQLDKWAIENGIDPRRLTAQDIAEMITWTGSPRDTKDSRMVDRILMPNPLAGTPGGDITFSGETIEKRIRKNKLRGGDDELATKYFGDEMGQQIIKMKNKQIKRDVEKFRNAAIEDFQRKVNNGEYVTMNQAVADLRRADEDTVYGVQLMLQQTGYWDREKSGFGDVKPIDVPGDPSPKTLKWYKMFLQSAIEQGGGYGARGGSALNFDEFIAKRTQAIEEAGIKIVDTYAGDGGGCLLYTSDAADE